MFFCYLLFFFRNVALSFVVVANDKIVSDKQGQDQMISQVQNTHAQKTAPMSLQNLLHSDYLISVCVINNTILRHRHQKNPYNQQEIVCKFSRLPIIWLNFLFLFNFYLIFFFLGYLKKNTFGYFWLFLVNFVYFWQILAKFGP